jgi:hypothetical protein
MHWLLSISGVAFGDRMKPRTRERAVIFPRRDVDRPWMNIT